jgi:GNAT superfamily N-acetyltransferase
LQEEKIKFWSDENNMKPENPPANFSIRSAQKSDCRLILEFVRELADYERLSHEVSATVEDFERELFGERPAAEVLLAEEGGEAVGFALFFTNFSTFLGRPGIYLEDLFVRPRFRNRGYGKALLSHLGKLAIERNCGRVEWAVLDWNQPAIDFYQSLGARLMKDWIINRVAGREAIEKLAQASP